MKMDEDSRDSLKKLEYKLHGEAARQTFLHMLRARRAIIREKGRYKILHLSSETSK